MEPHIPLRGRGEEPHFYPPHRGERLRRLQLLFSHHPISMHQRAVYKGAFISNRHPSQPLPKGYGVVIQHGTNRRNPEAPLSPLRGLASYRFRLGNLGITNPELDSGSSPPKHQAHLAPPPSQILANISKLRGKPLSNVSCFWP